MARSRCSCVLSLSGSTTLTFHGSAQDLFRGGVRFKVSPFSPLLLKNPNHSFSPVEQVLPPLKGIYTKRFCRKLLDIPVAACFAERCCENRFSSWRETPAKGLCLLGWMRRPVECHECGGSERASRHQQPAARPGQGGRWNCDDRSAGHWHAALELPMVFQGRSNGRPDQRGLYID